MGNPPHLFHRQRRQGAYARVSLHYYSKQPDLVIDLRIHRYPSGAAKQLFLFEKYPEMCDSIAASSAKIAEKHRRKFVRETTLMSKDFTQVAHQPATALEGNPSGGMFGTAILDIFSSHLGNSTDTRSHQITAKEGESVLRGRKADLEMVQHWLNKRPGRASIDAAKPIFKQVARKRYAFVNGLYAMAVVGSFGTFALMVFLGFFGVAWHFSLLGLMGSALFLLSPAFFALFLRCMIESSGLVDDVREGKERPQIYEKAPADPSLILKWAVSRYPYPSLPDFKHSESLANLADCEAWHPNEELSSLIDNSPSAKAYLSATEKTEAPSVSGNGESEGVLVRLDKRALLSLYEHDRKTLAESHEKSALCASDVVVAADKKESLT